MKAKFEFIKKLIFIFAAAVMLLGCTACFDTPYVAPFRISAGEVELIVDESIKITTNADGKVDWISLDEDIAVVENGLITAIGAGETTVIAVYGGVQKECAVKVSEPPEPVTVTISQTQALLEVEEELTLTAVVSDGSAVVWTSSNKEVATVSNGVVYGVSAGNAKITAKVGEASAACEITVVNKPEPVTVTLSVPTATVKEQKSIQLTATVSNGSAVTWTSSNEEVATVSNGIVYGVSAGKATITAAVGEVTATCEITVLSEPVTVTMSVPTAIVSVQNSIKLTATVSNGAAAAWSSSNTAVATVSNGRVYGLSVGKATITAAVGEATATCEITVINDPDTVKSGYTLLWHDEFNGDSLNMDNWSYQLGTRDYYGESVSADNWGNNELQSYKENNIVLEDGLLVITAKKENPRVDGKAYTSGRITSRGKFTTTYGYVEARIKLPAVSGMWPAFWMLPQPTSTEKTGNIYGGWPASGEIDIMEAKGRLPGQVGCAIHHGKSGGHDSAGKTITLSSNIDQWHTYAVDWSREYIAWIVDGVEVHREKSSRWWTGAVSSEVNPYAPFDVPFYIIMNLAVGGTYDQTGTDELKANEDFVSASMCVDYVRVYKPEN